jgi:hypothetical protein
VKAQGRALVGGGGLGAHSSGPGFGGHLFAADESGERPLVADRHDPTTKIAESSIPTTTTVLKGDSLRFIGFLLSRRASLEIGGHAGARGSLDATLIHPLEHFSDNHTVSTDYIACPPMQSFPRLPAGVE